MRRKPVNDDAGDDIDDLARKIFCGLTQRGIERAITEGVDVEWTDIDWAVVIPLLTPEQLRSVKGEMTEEEREVVEQAVIEAPGRLRHLIAPEVKRMLSEGEGEKINWLTVLKYLTAEELKEIMLTLTEEQREAIEQKLRDAVVEAHADLGRWDREYAKVRPLLEANPEWTVKDAVEHLRADGKIA